MTRSRPPHDPPPPAPRGRSGATAARRVRTPGELGFGLVAAPAGAGTPTLAAREAAAGAETAAQLLPALLAPLREQMSLFAFRGFLEPLLPGTLELDDDVAHLTLWAPSVFLADWVSDHYRPALEERAQALLGRRVAVAIVERPATLQSALDIDLASAAAADASVDVSIDTADVDADAPAADVVGRADRGRVVALAPRRTEVKGRRLDHRYTFDSFVAGKGNQMAFSAAWSVSERPGARYSPLFLFGPTGLGKTHLLHAIGHEILTRHPTLRVASLSAEQWVNEFIQGAHEKRFEAFRRRYRDDIDVLLIDDIQFLAGKAQSQDEFFHTFNALYESHKQIVVTSDRYPHEIAGLEDRLKTRFQWGLVCDVRPPDADTRRAILLKKAVDLGCALPLDVADFVSASITTSVRALEGALVRLSAWSQLAREPLTLEIAKDQLRGVLASGAHSPVTAMRVIDVVAAYHGMRPKDLTGPSRQRQVTRARQIAIWLCRHHLQMSLPELGRAFGGRDHTTALASVQKIDGLLVDDAGLKAVMARLEQSLF